MNNWIENGMHYAMLTQITQNANDEINAIIAAAALENRQLTAEETASMIDSYITLSENSGKSMTEIAEGQDALSANMRNMVSEVAIASLTQSGALSESASSQINSLGSVEDKVGALQWALDYYNRTGIPAKTINLDVSPALQAIADLQQRLYNIPDEQVYINVAENRVYTATGSSGSLGVGYAEGTDSHIGGPAVLGDGGREEPFLTPSGVFGVSPSTDTLYPNLPRGTQVWPSIKDFKLEIPHFATGAQGSTEAQRLIASFQNRELSGGSSSTSVSHSNQSSSEVVHNHINITAYGKLPQSTIKDMAETLSKEIKNASDRRSISRGERVTL